MTQTQLDVALSLALSGFPIDADDSVFAGYATPDFRPINVTIEQVAKLIRNQCIDFYGRFSQAMYDGIVLAADRFIV